MGLSDQTKVKIAPDKKGADATDITAGSAVLARVDKFVSFERAVHIVHGSQVIDAETALGDLTENEEHLSGLELQGNARIETPNAQPGELKLMSGDIDQPDVLREHGRGAERDRDGTSRSHRGDEELPERVLHAQNIEIGMAPDGTTLTSLTARDQVVLDLSRHKRSHRRT